MDLMIETDDKGTLTLPAEVLGGAKPHTRFRVETLDDGLVVRPCDDVPAEPQPSTLTAEEWLAAVDDLAERVGAEWKTDKSGAEIVSEMRRW